MATQITATLPTLNFPKDVDYPTQEDWAAFSVAAELNFEILGGSWSTQMQLWKTEANAMSTELNNSADIVQSTVNYKGDWISKGYALNESVSVSGIYYICKLTHATGQNPTDVSSLYWNLVIGNWNLKVDTNMSGYTSKTTPVDADLLALSDSASTFGIKKLSWANLKTTLKTYFDSLYTVSSSETVSGIIELATTAETQAGTDNSRAITPLELFNSLKGSNQSLASNGYQKLHGGLIIQWGTYSGVLTHTSSYTPIFPIAFPNACVKVLTQYGNTPVSTLSGGGYANIEARSNSSFTFQWGWYSGGSAQVSVDYIAIGY